MITNLYLYDLFQKAQVRFGTKVEGEDLIHKYWQIRNWVNSEARLVFYNLPSEEIDREVAEIYEFKLVDHLLSKIKQLENTDANS